MNATLQQDLLGRLKALEAVLDPGKLVGAVPFVGLTVASTNRQLRRGGLRQAYAQRKKGANLKGLGFLAARRLFPIGPTRVLLAIHLVRVSPRPLDDDNLAGAFKALRDGFAKGIGIDDRSPTVRYVTSWEPGPVGVRVEAYSITPAFLGAAP